MCSRHRFCKQSQEQEGEILAVNVKRWSSDLFHNLSSFYRCHIWTRHFLFPQEFSWNAISSLSWKNASFPQMAGAQPAPRLIATFCLMLRTSRELAVTRRCQKFEKNTNSRQVSLSSDKQCGSSLSTFVLSWCWWTAEDLSSWGKVKASVWDAKAYLAQTIPRILLNFNSMPWRRRRHAAGFRNWKSQLVGAWKRSQELQTLSRSLF